MMPNPHHENRNTAKVEEWKEDDSQSQKKRAAHLVESATRGMIISWHQFQTPLSRIITLSSKSLYYRVQSPRIQKIWYMGCAVYKYHECLFFGIVCAHRSHYKCNVSLTSTFSTIILTVSSNFDGFCSIKVCRQSNRGHECSSRVFRGPKYEGASLHIKFSKTYPFSNSVTTIVHVRRASS